MRYYHRTLIFLICSAVVFLASCATSGSTSEAGGSILYYPTAFADAESRFISIDGVNIHYKEYGSGEKTLLMLHGLLGNLEGWKFIIPGLSTDYRVVAYDRPAFGLSGRPEPTEDNNPYTPEAYEQECLELIDSLGLGKPVLVGHSAGGNLALRIAIKYPDRISGLILISPGVYTEIPPAIIRELMEMGLLQGSALDVIHSLPEHAEQILAQNYYRPELIDGQLKKSYLRITSLENWDRALLNFLMFQDDSMLAGGISRINLPTVIIQGLQDGVVPPSDNLKAAALMKNAALVYLPACGHVAQEEKPEQTLAVIRNFLEEAGF